MGRIDEVLAYWTSEVPDRQPKFDRSVMGAVNRERARFGLAPLDNLDELRNKWRAQEEEEDRLDSKRAGVIYPEDLGGL